MGKLYIIGIGPGDPELLTLKGLRIIEESSSLCVPKGREEGKSIALSIVKNVVNLSHKKIIELYFPMKKDKEKVLKKEAKKILKELNKGDVAFVTTGDPTIYSTGFYLYSELKKLNQALEIEIIPGVSSINAACAKAKIPLSLFEEKIAILPAIYTDNLKEIIERFDTIVLMKVNKVFDHILKRLKEMKRLENAIYLAKVGTKDEKFFKNITEVKQKDLNYFSMVIIKK